MRFLSKIILFVCYHLSLYTYLQVNIQAIILNRRIISLFWQF